MVFSLFVLLLAVEKTALAVEHAAANGLYGRNGGGIDDELDDDETEPGAPPDDVDDERASE